jgi:prepilin-type N-terminal cleavage/methylation domain-containing protein
MTNVVWKPRLASTRDAGFSVMELLMTVSLISIVSTMAVIQVGLAQPAMKGDGALRVLIAQLNSARELSISQRRQMQVNFIAPNQVQIVRQEVPAGTTVLSTVYIEGGIQYSLMAGVPDTPDGFGNAVAVNFGAAQKVFFNSDGTLIDQGGNPLNGSVFTALPSQPRSFRALTILGGTGRIRGYRWDSAHWVLM